MSIRDERLDGWFVVAVTSIGVYCRPSCPAPVRPKREHVRFFASSAAAQQAGFRACKRCRPDASPGSPEWNTRSDLVARAVRLIGDGVIDREGVPGLARRLAVSERHLGRLMRAELGAAPLALARAQRAQTARTLIERTELPFAAVAQAAGFSSLRPLNETVRHVFAATPTELRARGAHRDDGLPGSVTLRLPVRAPFCADELFRFLGERAVPGVEEWRDRCFRRVLSLPRGHGIAELAPTDGYVRCELRLEALRDLPTAVQRCRRLLDLDADPRAVDEVLAADRQLRPLVRRRPGVRSPGAVDGAELAVRAILGQQVSVAGARTQAGRLAAALGSPLAERDGGLLRAFPDSAAIAGAPDAALPIPAARRDAIRRVAAAVAAGELALDAGADRDESVRRLLGMKGIGPWTAAYVAMRALSDPDVLLTADLGVRHAVSRLGLDASADRVQRWRPWRSYVTHHLWASLSDAAAQ
jgi:AraC family transcriptional regulator of adaptative response / DNA-3-methyladenine glycosylase II